MNINMIERSSLLRPRTELLLQRLLSPLCGINQQIGYVLKSRHDPRIITTGAELTGVHLLRDQPHPGPGAYHIGGSGPTLDEALIRTLGESVERYAQYTSLRHFPSRALFMSYRDMLQRDQPLLSDDALQIFHHDQLTRQGFVFRPFTRDQPITWVQLPSLITNEFIWVPAQLVYLGYRLRIEDCEPFLNAAVTTGTATHSDRIKSLYNALCELIQIDSAMGHWYSDNIGQKIVLDDSVAAVRSAIEKMSHPNSPQHTFYFLPNPHFSLFTVACVIRQEKIPRVAAGLGCDMCLEDALYSAYLEAFGVYQLAKVVLLRQQFSDKAKAPTTTFDNIYDLDSNVAFYASGNHLDFFNAKFSDEKVVTASDIQLPMKSSIVLRCEKIIEESRSAGKEIVFADLTNREAESLGLTVARVWSPDLLSLCMPSAVPREHQRFADYGGIAHEYPHPYP